MVPSSTIPLPSNTAVAYKLLCCFLILAGFTTVLAISVHILEWVPMHITAPFVVLPILMTVMVYGMLFPVTGRLLLTGWLFGIVAVALYDISRLPFMMGGWTDFIPRIGGWVFHRDDMPGIFGYAWRYFGNGGGMGMSFVLLVHLFSLRKHLIAIGIAYGLFIYSNLILTLLIAPHGEELMFKLTPLNCFGSFIGHVVYGWVLGVLVRRSVRAK